MKIIKTDLSSELESVELHIFADEHIGDANCDIDRVIERIEYVKNTPNAYCILNGDLLDNATKTSIGDTYTQVFNPMGQLARAVELFSPIKDKILCITHGNHENRTYKKEGINLSRLIADQLGLSDVYSPTSAILFLRFGMGTPHTHNNKPCYTIYTLHGSGGGRKEGAKAIRLADMACRHLHPLSHPSPHDYEASISQSVFDQQFRCPCGQALCQYRCQSRLWWLR